LFPETIIRLTDFDTYGPPDAAPIAPPPVAASGRVTFGSFSGLPKIGPEVVALWARILRDVPDSRLILVSPGLDDETQRTRLRDEFGARGVAGDRLELIGRIPGRMEYISTYNRIDIALDPFPFGGGTVTNEAMYMGVPVVALDGDYGYRRMTVGLLANAGCAELIASDFDGYVAVAKELAADPARIASYKNGLRAKCMATIFNSRGHVRELEDAYRAVWERFCRS